MKGQKYTGDKTGLGSMSGILWQRMLRLMLVVSAVLICSLVYPQETVNKVTRHSALEAFTKGNYEEALSGFTELLVTYPRDPLYRYYSGVSLVKLMRDPVRASVLLKEASEGPADLKPVPVDVWFYLGRARQMAADYSDAIVSYNTFSGKAGRKLTKKLEVEKFIKECNERKGELTGFEIIQAGMVEKPAAETLHEKKTDPEIDNINAPEDLPQGFEAALVRGMDYQLSADSMLATASAYRKQLETAPDEQKAAIRKRIAEIESQAADYRKQSDQVIVSAQSESGAEADTSKPVTEANDQEIVPAIQTVADNYESPETKQTPEADIARDDRKDEIFSMFEVVTDQGKIAGNVIEIDPGLPAGLVYRLQIAVFSKPVDPSTFKGIMPVSGFSVKGSNIKRYYAGMFRKAQEAGRALLQVKQLGFRDAFLTAVMNGDPVSLDRAALLEKEWGDKPLFEKEKPSDQARQEQVPKTLAFRVEIARSAKQVTGEMEGIYRRIAGNRGLDIINTTDGTFVYLIGKFITFESAFEYTDLLVRNGYRDARVTAWIGDTEIDVETAKELFEKK